MKNRLLFLGTFFILFCCTKQNDTGIPLSGFVPNNASTVLKINDFQALKSGLKNNEFLQKIRKTQACKSLFKDLAVFDHLEISDESVLAFIESGEDNLEYLIVANDSTTSFQIEDVKNKSVEKISNENKEFTKYSIEDNILYSALAKGKILFCSSEKLLENAIRKAGIDNIPVGLEKLYSISDQKKPATAFIQNKIGNSILSRVLNSGKKEKLMNLADWMSLDLDIGQDYIDLTGVSISNDSVNNFLDLLGNTNPLESKVIPIVPKNTDLLYSYTFDDSKAFFENQQNYFNKTIERDTLFSSVEEVALIEVNNKKAIVLSVYESENILKFLSGLKKNTFMFQGNEITTLSSANFLNDSFNPLVQDFKANHFLLLGDNIVFAENIETLQTVISNYNSQSTLGKTAFFKTVKENLVDEASFQFLSNSKGLKDFFNESFLSEIKKDIQEYTFSGQITADNQFYLSNLSIRKIGGESANNTTSSLYTVQLDNDLATNPQFVTNHRTGKKETVVQDQENNLYLISPEGKVLWKKQLKGTIQGKIHQVDIYKNGRLQLAFATDNQFLILDRNGEIVQPFEISFEGGNLNSLAVFDYDKRKDYRFIVTQGDKVFMLNNKGNIVSGFKYIKATSPILAAPNHFRIKNKDYLIFKLEDGSLKILNRVGNNRVNVKEKIDFSENSTYLYKDKFTVTDKKGFLYSIDQKGKINKTDLNLDNDHGIDATNKTLAVMNDNILTIKGKKIELDLGVYTKPRIFYINDKIYINVTDIQNQKIHLFDSQAKSIQNFPVFGNSAIDMTDMDNDKKLELVAKDQDNSLILYRIN